MAGMEVDPNGLEVLGRSACLGLLGTLSVGRLALCIDALPVVLPVRFALDGEDLVVSALAGERIRAALDDSVVAFQADGPGTGSDGDIAWSVLVQGSSRVLDDGGAGASPPRVFGKRSCDQLAAIRTDLVCGRRVW
jgi:nitroimidazol reductase NimA-like FMN-containing flavoprotein (pyridoxamine 5'-phosphate oxidase superfamily)